MDYYVFSSSCFLFLQRFNLISLSNFSVVIIHNHYAFIYFFDSVSMYQCFIHCSKPVQIIVLYILTAASRVQIEKKARTYERQRTNFVSVTASITFHQFKSELTLSLSLSLSLYQEMEVLSPAYSLSMSSLLMDEEANPTTFSWRGVDVYSKAVGVAGWGCTRRGRVGGAEPSTEVHILKNGKRSTIYV